MDIEIVAGKQIIRVTKDTLLYVDDEGIEQAIKILESMRSKPSDPVEAAQEDDGSDDTFDDDFKEDNL